MRARFQEHLQRGVELFNRQEFYEAHEVWEAAWAEELSDDRLLLQGLIQVAAGFYKLQTGSPQGTVKLLLAGERKLQPFRPRAHGVEVEALLSEVARWREEAARLSAANRRDYDPALLPRIHFRPSPLGRGEG
ncbi:MAG: DUF309 domain-containing protein [Myxococcota bacterium]